MAIEPADLFSANQIIHLRPIVGHDVFERFVKCESVRRGLLSELCKRSEPQARKPQALKSALERILSLGASRRSRSASRARSTAGTCDGARRLGSRATRCGSNRSA